jgi:predicted dienelactone hydrolase
MWIASFAMAPGPAPAFIPESHAKISIPVARATGSADEIAPADSGADALGKAMPGRR